jgi:ubiquinone/menaquinone biosynthesis C-methylase UbiE
VTGVDFAPRAIKLARRKVDQAGAQVELWVKDATKLDGIAGPFELAFDLGCFHTLPREGKNKYLEQLDRVLARDGFWLMYGFLKPETLSAAPGLAEADLSQIASRLTLLSRRTGFDDKGNQSSAWFLFQKRNTYET